MVKREYIKARMKAEKTRDPVALKKMRMAERKLEKAENEADKTMDPILKKRADQLLKRLWTISDQLNR